MLTDIVFDLLKLSRHCILAAWRYNKYQEKEENNFLVTRWCKDGGTCSQLSPILTESLSNSSATVLARFRLKTPDAHQFILHLFYLQAHFQKNLRRTVMRYVNLSTILVYRLVSKKVSIYFLYSLFLTVKVALDSLVSVCQCYWPWN